ncbi:metallophosphoesterase [Leptospira sp. 'Mane']|uniref:metallophosphoesterase n=1 Tax=Leptospira sp. 'Mane' TaxID=3387407 RepID=UPI00398B3E12
MKFALIGDIHGFWNERDIEYFNNSDYDVLFFAGDLGKLGRFGKIGFDFSLAGLHKKAYLIPGNWDGTNVLGLLGEAKNISLFKWMGSFGYAKRMKIFSEKIRPIPIMGYSSVVLSDKESLTLVVGRPHAMGEGFSFAKNLSSVYGVRNQEESKTKYKTLLDSISQDNLIFLSHNGSYGLGDKATSIYGADFKKEGGDIGDEDLQFAIQYAKDKGKKVPAVLSGHMHHYSPIAKKERESIVYTGGTTYINGAKVPRIRKGKQFHTKIEWNGGSVTAIPVWV